MKRRALISVSEKSGIEEIARRLLALEKDQWGIVSSGGTAKHIAAAGYPVTDISVLVQKSAKRLIMQALENLGLNYDETLLDGFIDEIDASILDHLVLSLRPEVHGGLLAQQKHAVAMAELGFEYIDLAIVDFYPLKKALDKVGATVASIIDATDMGGPAMVGSGAKGSIMGQRLVVCDRADWIPVIERLETGYWPEQGDEYSTALAAKAFGVVAAYRLESARFHSGGKIDGMMGTRVIECKYGENPWQKCSGLFVTNSGDPLALSNFELIAGTAPSYVNLTDVDRMLQTITHIAAADQVNKIRGRFIALGAKHGNACGVGVSEDVAQALKFMLDGDSIAIFGGYVMTNFVIHGGLADILLTYGAKKRRLLDGIVAPRISHEAVELLQRKNGKCRLFINSALQSLSLLSLDTATRFRYVRGGFVKQHNYTHILQIPEQVEIVGQDDAEVREDLILAWAIGATSNSNTITLVKDDMLIANAVGQQSRVDAAKLAIAKALAAGHDPTGSVAYSDSFFPFPDGPQVLIDAGVRAILASSGSVNDELVKQVCRDTHVPLYLIPDTLGRGFYGH